MSGTWFHLDGFLPPVSVWERVRLGRPFPVIVTALLFLWIRDVPQMGTVFSFVICEDNVGATGLHFQWVCSTDL